MKRILKINLKWFLIDFTFLIIGEFIQKIILIILTFTIWNHNPYTNQSNRKLSILNFFSGDDYY